MADQILSAVLSIATTVITGIVTAILIPALAKWLSAKTQNETIRTVMAELAHTVSVSVEYVNQTFVNQLKADGKFDKEAQATALGLALQDAIQGLSDKTMEVLTREGIDIEQMIIRYIEAQISRNKSALVVTANKDDA